MIAYKLELDRGCINLHFVRSSESLCLHEQAAVGIVSDPDPMDAAADGLHHRYVSLTFFSCAAY